MTTYIYGFCAPGSDKVMYVGKSIDPENRYDDHLKSAERGESSPKYDWIRELSKEDKQPDMIILDEDDGDGHELEIKWIVKLSALNKALLNVIGNPLRRGHKRSATKSRSGGRVFTMRMTEREYSILEYLSGESGMSKGKTITTLLSSEFMIAPNGYLSSLSDGIIDKKLENLTEEPV